MAVTFSDSNVWTRDSYFARSNDGNGDPTNVSLNPFQNLTDYPCKETWRSGGTINAVGNFDADKESSKQFNQMANILKAYPNVKYCGMTQEESNKMLYKQQMSIMETEKLNKNSFFSEPDDQEKKNRSATVAIELKNPEFILSKVNDKAIDEDLEDTNAIRRRWDQDTGAATFDYSPEDSDRVKMVEDSNVNYVARRDRFVTPSSESVQGTGATAQAEMLKLLEKQEMQYEAMRASIPQRNKPGKSVR